VFDIHPEYYLILPRMFDEKLRSRFDEWVYILKTSKARDDFKAAGIEEAKAKLDYLHMSPEKKKAYERFMENRSSLTSVILTAEAKGERKGRREGLREGLQQGLQQGIKGAFDANLSVAQIAKIFKRPTEDIKRILDLKITKKRTSKKT